MKSGGTSVGDAGCIRRAAAIVRESAERDRVVVVSALAGVTDTILKAVRVETHPVNLDEYRFLTEGGIRRCPGDIPVAPSFAIDRA